MDTYSPFEDTDAPPPADSLDDNTSVGTIADPEVENDGKFKIRVNGDIVWSSEGEAMLVDQVKINNARGEVTVVGSSNTDAYMDITVHERSFESPSSYLDMIEAEKAAERRTKYEPEPDTTREGYVQADPETGVPMEDTRVPTAEETKAANKEADKELVSVPETGTTDTTPDLEF